MIRTFQTTTIRRQQELTEHLWEFEALEGDKAGEKRKVALPSCVECLPGYENYRGKAAFRTDFTVPGESGNIRLCFKGISLTAEFYLDGTPAGSHYNAYTPFELVINGLAPGSIHRLEVTADNSYSEKSALHIPNDYESYLGITRPVLLESVSDCFMEWVHITPIWEAEGWKARIEASLRNTAASPFCGKLEVSLCDACFSIPDLTVPSGECRVVGLQTDFLRAEAWSPENPCLTTVRTVLYRDGKAVDDCMERTGFRTVEVKENQILLNGRPLYIKGFCRHEDHGLFGCAIPYTAMDYDLNLLSDLGANSVRTSHYPNDERFLDLCDEKGILVWEENHARGLSEEQMRNPFFERQCEDCIREMITAHYNHPSIYIWGILNECANHTPYGASCYEKQFALIRKLDASRPRTTASCRFKLDLTIQTPEVKAYNIYPEWYHDRRTEEFAADLYDWIREQCGGEVPFLISEIGAGAIYGWRDNRRTKWSEDYQAEALEKQIRGVFGLESCNGLYLWQFCDTRVSEEWFGPRPRTMNNKGVVDELRRKKLSYDVVKRLFKEKGNYRDARQEKTAEVPGSTEGRNGNENYWNAD